MITFPTPVSWESQRRRELAQQPPATLPSQRALRALARVRELTEQGR